MNFDWEVIVDDETKSACAKAGSRLLSRTTPGRCGGRSGIFYGWIVVWAAFTLLMIQSGISYSMPVLFRFFEADFTIGRGQAAFIFSCSQVMAFAMGPFAGSLADKFGPRAVVGGGLLTLAAGLLGAAQAQSYGELLVSYGMAFGIGSGAIYIPLLGMIQRWFYHRRGLASGLATSGVSIGTLTFPIVCASAADAFGWRSLYLGFAMLCFSIGLFAVCVLVPDPRERGLKPDSVLEAAVSPCREQPISGLSLSEAFRDGQFYLLYFCSFGAAVLTFMALVHLPQHAAEASGAKVSAATIISVIGLFGLVARLGGGSWADHIGRLAMIRIALLLSVATSSLWLMNDGSAGILLLVAALFGITHGLCIALLPAVIADSFGNKEISRIIGAIYTSFALAALVGPTAAGVLHDHTGNYDAALAACIVLSIVTAVASTGVRRRY
jgi:MFS transporter, OFA family, oxalate/formate antiporter